MKHVLILERNLQSLTEHFDDRLKETNQLFMGGSFTEFDIENRNKRFYTAENFIPCMNALLEKKKMLSVIYGELDHPDVFDIAGKNVSHTIEELTHNEQHNRVDGKIKLLTTPNGMTARAIINDNCPLFVSSRAAGITEGKNVQLKELFTYDIVVDPGFATSVVTNVNEKYGFSNDIDVPYRIYEMKNESDVNNLFNDNKNDRKTEMDIKEMQLYVANEIAKLENVLVSKIKEGKSTPLELDKLLEQQQIWNEEMSSIKKYLDVFKTKINYLVKENKSLKESNIKLNNELNENTIYANHLASGFNNIKENINKIDTKLDTSIAFTESVAKETEVTQKFAESIARETEVTQKFAESVAKETEIAQMFAESIAKETEVTQKFVESVAKETEVAQMFAESIAKETKITRDFSEYIANENKITREFSEYIANETMIGQKFTEMVANELNNEDIWLNYVAEKVDGIIKYIPSITENLNKNVNESLNTPIESIDSYLGITEEQENWNSITNNIEDETLEDETLEDTTLEDTTLEDDTNSQIVSIDNAGPDVSDIPTDVNMNNTTDDNGSLENSLLSKLVKILGSDETGIVIEITPDNKLIIQKSGLEQPETIPYNMDEIEEIDTENNIAETVSNVLEEIKKQTILANKQPHFFTFLSEDNLSNFKQFDKTHQNDIILAMENATYTSEKEVLNIIGNVLNKSSISYEENLINNIPDNIKESWNSLNHNEKISLLSESKYFPLKSKSDIKSFWNTRPFAKKVISPEAILIKENYNSNDINLSENYVDAFIKSMNNLK